MSSISKTPAWQALSTHARDMEKRTLLELFAGDPNRATRFTIEYDEILLDYSKQRVTAQTLSLLLDLARQADVEGLRRRMFAGDAINESENRAVLHVALRSDQVEFPAGRSVMGEVRECRERMREFVRLARSGKLLGSTGLPITDFVNLGIGGSDLGPRLVTEALSLAAGTGPGVHFAANFDPADLSGVLRTLNPETTLFIVASKSFSTMETLDNVRRAREWLGGRPDSGDHFAAVTANVSAARELGIDRQRIFPAWDWVGGRYSVWSAMGLSAAIAIGDDAFDALLEGARQMDAHFHTAPLEANMPVLLALLGVWNINFCGAESHAILPYCHALRKFPSYLQQLEMESNGKHVDRQGLPVDYATAPVIWGYEGTLSQHSFHQLLHQGTTVIPVDFIVPLHGPGDGKSQNLLVSNAFAQGAALLAGTPVGTAPHAASTGNRPSSTLLIERLSPEALGQLISLYEHKVFVQGALWNINSFDQWGVEQGKKLAHAIAEGPAIPNIDASTAALMRRSRRG